MNHFFIVLFMILAGSLSAVQGVANSALGKQLGEPIHAALISFGIGFIILAIISIFVTGSFPSISKLSSAPPITLIGGLLGAVFITSIIFIVPKIGIANAVVAALCGQVILSLILDHFGVMGLTVNSISPQKIVGSGLLILGLLLINGKIPFGTMNSVTS